MQTPTPPHPKPQISLAGTASGFGLNLFSPGTHCVAQSCFGTSLALGNLGTPVPDSHFTL